MVTSEVGCDVSAKPKPALVNVSLVLIDVGETVTPATSLSVFVAETVVFIDELYLLSPVFIDIETI